MVHCEYSMMRIATNRDEQFLVVLDARYVKIVSGSVI